MDSLYFLIKSLSFGESPNLFNMISDFTSETTVRNIEIPSSIFVVSEQGWDTSVCKRVFKPPRLKSQI